MTRTPAHTHVKQDSLQKGIKIMKKRNIAAAILLASMMAVSTCAVTSMTAMAGSIAVDTAADTGNTYKAYQILTGTIATNGELSNVAFGDALNLTGGKLPDNLVTALKTSSGLTAFSELTEDTTPAAFADMISNLDSAGAEKFAKVIGKYVTGTGTAITTTATDVDDGYYVVKEEGTGTPKTLNLLKVAGTVTLNAKEGTPTSAKTVVDTNDSYSSTDTHTKTADYDIGDDVPYTLTFTLPENYDKYEKYPVTFWDDMCAGLSLNTSSVKIKYGNADAQSITFSTAVPADNKTSAYSGGTVYKYAITDLKETAPSLGNSDTITITYTAKLTGDAVVVGGTGNPNSYTVQYANDPNWTSIPGPDDTTPPTNPPTTETPEDKNVVFTYQLTVNKVDDDNKPLNGATFTLFKWTDKTNTATIDATSGWTQVNQIQLTNASTFEFKGLDDGVYKLVETTPPTHYNGIDPIQFEITATHNDATYDLGTVSQTGFDNASVSDGVISVNIQNNKGMTLPSTGGIGTTIFYVVGGTLVAGAVVLLITKKRMSINDQK